MLKVILLKVFQVILLKFLQVILLKVFQDSLLKVLKVILLKVFQVILLMVLKVILLKELRVILLKVLQDSLLKVFQVILDSRRQAKLVNNSPTLDSNILQVSNIQVVSSFLPDTPLQGCQVPFQVNIPLATTSLPLTAINQLSLPRCTLECRIRTFLLLHTMEARVRAREMYGGASTSSMARITQWSSRNLRSRIT